MGGTVKWRPIEGFDHSYGFPMTRAGKECFEALSLSDQELLFSRLEAATLEAITRVELERLPLTDERP